MNKGIVIPQKKSINKSDSMIRHMLKSQVGIYKWVLSFDLNSLYPHLIMQYNIHSKLYEVRKNCIGNVS